MARRHASPTPVGALLTAALPLLAERLRALEIQRGWAEVVGPEIAHRSQPGDVRGGTLTVMVDNSPWLQELRLREGELLRRLQARYGAGAVTALQFILGEPRRAPAAAEGRPARGEERLTAEESAWVERATSPIGDPSLAETVRRVLAKDTLARRGAGARP